MDIRHYQHTTLFYSTSIIIPWTLWFFVAYISHTYPNQFILLTSAGGVLGLLAPLLVALVLIIPNEDLRKDLTGRLFNLRAVSPKYLSFTFLLMPFSILTAQLISLFFGYDTAQFQFRGGYTFTSGVFPVWFLLIIAPLVEELAWHSYGTDCLRNRFSLLNTSLLFALLWGVWHLPLSFIKDYYHSNLVESGLLYSINFFVSLFPFVLIMNWLYYKTNRNILISVIFHISAGYFNEIFATDPMSKVIQTGLLTMFSIYLIIQDKSFFIKN
jgi:membrane protease YdiL (CAAX protease family)